MAQGIFRGQRAALALARRIAYLPINAAVRETAKEYLEAQVAPTTKPGDAAHLACASVHGMGYLLSWNQTHLSNDETQRKLEIVNTRLGLRSPLLRTPYTIPKAAMGQEIRRVR